MMWIVWKKVGIFEHYLGTTGSFLPMFAAAKRFPSKTMADAMAKKYGGIVRELRPDSTETLDPQL